MINQATDLDASMKVNRLTEDMILKRNEEAVKQHYEMLLMCGEYAAIGRPFLCAGLRRYIAEIYYPGIEEEIRAAVKNAVKYEKRAVAESINVFYSEDGKYIHIEIQARFVNADKSFIYQSRLRRIL